MDPAFLSVQSLSFLRLGKAILHTIDLSVSRGSITILCGPSGGGKSTLLQLVNRLLEPPPGTIWLDGVDITTLEPQRLRRRVGMVFQQPTLFPGTVADNVRYGPNVAGETMRDEVVHDLLRAASLEPALAGEDAERLSGGQAQRVALARALANRPDMLLLDEPTSALDPYAARQVEETLLRLNTERDLTLLWVTHDPAQAQRVGHQLVLLQQGRIVDQASATELAEQLAADSPPESPLCAFIAGELGRSADVEAGGGSGENVDVTLSLSQSIFDQGPAKETVET